MADSPLFILPKKYMEELNNMPSELMAKIIFIRNIYIKLIKELGYENINPDEVYKNYPINPTKNLQLLGEYIANTVFCKFVEKVVVNENQLQIKLDGNSIYEELNEIRGIINNNYIDLCLIFNYN